MIGIRRELEKSSIVGTYWQRLSQTFAALADPTPFLGDVTAGGDQVNGYPGGTTFSVMTNGAGGVGGSFDWKITWQYRRTERIEPQKSPISIGAPVW